MVRIWKNVGEWTEKEVQFSSIWYVCARKSPYALPVKVEIRVRKKFLAVGEPCIAIF